MSRVGVIGAGGRMGRLVSAAVVDDPDLELAAGVDPSASGQPLGPIIGRPNVEVTAAGDLDALAAAGADVAVDFTRPDVVMEHVRWAIDHRTHIVVGTSGVGPDRQAEIRGLLQARPEGSAASGTSGTSKTSRSSNVLVVPNFAIGAALMQRFSVQAARFFPSVEIIELHHEGKLDAPSGTAAATAEAVAEARTEEWRGPGGESVQGVRGGEVAGIRVHSVRLPGLVAHQEVIFGGPGQTLSMRHDSLARESFLPGVLLAIKGVASLPGLTVGLDALLDRVGGRA